MHGALAAVFLAAAGLVAGVIGTAGGITSLVAYPALLAAGIPPFAANTTNSVALLGSGLGSALRAGRDVAGHGPTLRAWLPLNVALSLAGAALLVLTPGALFDRIVPFLVAAGSLVLLLQPVVRRRQEQRGRPLAKPVVRVLGGVVAVYNGYFGAGAGILLIALLLLSSEPVLHRANALKNVILVVSDLLPAVLFAMLGTVVWAAVWPLALGALAGGLVGPAVARRVPASILRVLIALSGLVLASSLLLAAR